MMEHLGNVFAARFLFFAPPVSFSPAFVALVRFQVVLRGPAGNKLLVCELIAVRRKKRPPLLLCMCILAEVEK